MLLDGTCFRSFAGYCSARMYKVLKGQQWFRNALVVSLWTICYTVVAAMAGCCF